MEKKNVTIVIKENNKWEFDTVVLMVSLIIDLQDKCGFDKAHNKSIKYLNECYEAGRYDCGVVIDRWAKKYPSKSLKEHRRGGQNIKSFVGKQSDICDWTSLMFKAFGWD